MWIFIYIIGNAVLLGVCDVIISTRTASFGMGGPAMIEGGGLGKFSAKEIGPAAMHFERGVADILVDDEEEACRVTLDLVYHLNSVKRRRMVSHQIIIPRATPDQNQLRTIVPENRNKVFDIRSIIRTLSDASDSFIELRGGWGKGIVTGLTTICGVSVGVFANDCMIRGGAIDAEAADKAADFLLLMNAHRLPILSLCDTPGFIVGPEDEKEGLVRRCARLFTAGVTLTVPLMLVIVRRSFGLGGMAMGGGSHRVPVFTIGWPTSQIGAMGLEGAVRLAFRKELNSIRDAAEREKYFEMMVQGAYEEGRGVVAAKMFEIDAVIDPRDTRVWIGHVVRGWRDKENGSAKL